MVLLFLMVKKILIIPLNSRQSAHYIVTDTDIRSMHQMNTAMNTQPWRFIVYSDRIYVFALKTRFPGKSFHAMREFSIGIMLSHIMLAAEELWMELQTETEEHFAAKSYKNGDYVATLTLH